MIGYLRQWILLGGCLLLQTSFPLLAQYGDPGAREDEAIERQKILKAADQIDLLVQQNQKFQQDILKLQQQVAVLQTDKESLAKKLDDLEKNAARDKQLLLKEVAGIVASKSGNAPVPPKVEKPPVSPAANLEGYEYEVKSGDSLWAIAKAYQDAGVKVSVEDIRKANNMSQSQALKAGQKLFIPKN